MAGSDGYLVGLMGRGIGPSLTPPLHEREATRLGLRYTYRRLDLDDLPNSVRVEELLVAAGLMGFDGLNVTHPCKRSVLAHLDTLSPDAAAIGAVNTVVLAGGRAVGHNTDWWGFARGLEAGLPTARLDGIVLLGAGGAGAAVGHALLSLAARRVTVVDTVSETADRLAADLGARFGRGRAVSAPHDRLRDVLAGADGLVHATPVGMAAHPGLPVPEESLRADLWVADVVYRPLETGLVRAARAAGATVLDGGRMAVFQAVESFRLFTGVEPDADRMLVHFTELIRDEGRGRDERAA